MKLFKPFALLAIAAASVVMLTSAVPYSEKPADKTPVNVQKATLAWEKAAADGNVSTKELKGIVTELKGSKLTLKEKVGLKLFGKKITSKMNAVPRDGDKSQVIALILCIVVGGLGIHRFYLGYTWQGIVQLLTLGVCGIWTLIDLIRIITGDLQPKNGTYTTTL
ncbi:TM2 domain-containing protein [Paraflavitalea soli]|nr:TM2 domain-containing protein [Paraflavitalea soli]